MNRFTGAGWVIALCLIAGSATATELRYNRVDLRYIVADTDSEKGFGLDLQGLVTPSLYVVLGFNDSGIRQVARYGGGYRYALHPSATDLFVEAIGGGVKVDGFPSVSGFGGSAGIRHLFTPALEGMMRVDYLSLDDPFGDDLSFTASGDWHFSRRFSLVMKVSVEEETNSAGLGFRFSL
jgi:hypothetical protein